ncbi:MULTISPECIES: SAM-dependent methyltransferase [unclassified Imperialibacter]|uniref:SAM-dependent methyltransferase n=1 Tax=unclassified Imperialibacter TaxID=2629706 RepID=UPI0012540A36|nr:MULTISPECIES: SAM-dependent methyltransferase [unclassified Imperialibacter]CAD5289361.1 SAM-dependent methyltransferase [Imperialibacter sp. 89]CAD5289587.1 SAM-dependent methyltransferase [Imperialibacter sp. 75]VVT34592.1 putative methyltransferase [Imperialibacter sp. EC-SDR9]
MSAGKLYLVPSPLSDNRVDLIINGQVKEIISSLNWFFAENIRTSRRFISSLNLGRPIESLHFAELNKDTKDAEVSKLMDIVISGESAGVISEAGCPGIADPGAKIVALAHKKGVEVIPLVGPSSIFLALMGSGFSGQSFTFHGYLPIDKKAAQDKIRQMEKEVVQQGTTQIFMETPYRNNQLVEVMINTCQNNSLLCIASDITGETEFIQTKKISDWRVKHPNLHKIPTVFLLGK